MYTRHNDATANLLVATLTGCAHYICNACLAQ